MNSTIKDRSTAAATPLLVLAASYYFPHGYFQPYLQFFISHIRSYL